MKRSNNTTSHTPRIRPESAGDAEAIRQVNEQAFGRPEEARLVEALREGNNVVLSLVAVDAGQVVGHILFCPVIIEAEGNLYDAVGLGPMAVLPAFQNRGVGSALVRAGLEALRNQEHAAVVVLGHPEFYPRFGFVPASRHGIRSRYDVPDAVFMVAELAPGALAGKGGTVAYPPEFDAV